MLGLVLAHDEEIGIGREASADLTQLDASHTVLLKQYLNCCYPDSVRRGPLHDAQHVVRLKRSRLHSQRPRLASQALFLVDHQRAYAQPRQPAGEHEARWARSDDQNIRTHRSSLMWKSLPSSCFKTVSSSGLFATECHTWNAASLHRPTRIDVTKHHPASRYPGCFGERGFWCIKLSKQTGQLHWLVLGRHVLGRMLLPFHGGLPLEFNPIAIGIRAIE